MRKQIPVLEHVDAKVISA